MNISKHLKLSFCILHSALCISTVAAYAATVDQVIVRQQWPWSTDVKVEFKLTGVTTPVTVNVTAYNGAEQLDSSRLASAITGELWGITESGAYSFMIDPIRAFGTDKVALGDFRVRLTLTDAPANAGDILYKIVDLDPPYKVTDVRRRDFYNGKYGNFVTNFADIASGWTTSLDDVLIWTGVTEDDTYKTNKMVFRRIPAAGKSFQFQKGITEATNAYYTAGQGIKVSFSKDYYIGVFEVTQSQFVKMADGIGYGSFTFTNAVYRETRPADTMCAYWYNNVGPAVRHESGGIWPTDTSHRKSSSSQTKALVPSMQYKTGLLVDMPTAAMWEYACRAGTDTFMYSGASGTANNTFNRQVQRAYGINGGGTSGVTRNDDTSRGTMTVGSYKPNAWGLYDMLGNVYEWCLDSTQTKVQNFWMEPCYSQADNVDPVGPTSNNDSKTTTRVMRGGNYKTNPRPNGSMQHESRYGNTTDAIGVRLCIYLDENDNGTFER